MKSRTSAKFRAPAWSASGLKVLAGLTLLIVIGVAGMGSLVNTAEAAPCGPKGMPNVGEIPDFWWIADDTTREIVARANGELINGADYAPGVAGSAFSFNGDYQNVTVTDSPAWDFGPCDFTISLWAKANTEFATGPFIAHNEGPGNLNKWIFWVQPWGGLTFHINAPDMLPEGGLNVVTYDEGSFFMEPDRWYHLAVTKSGSQYYLYLNGRRRAGEEGPLMIPDAITPLTIGQTEDYSFDGLIDEVKIYKRALSYAEVRTFGYLQGIKAIAEE
jgi:hypothetical protein